MRWKSVIWMGWLTSKQYRLNSDISVTIHSSVQPEDLAQSRQQRLLSLLQFTILDSLKSLPFRSNCHYPGGKKRPDSPGRSHSTRNHFPYECL
jgi:hypothetical protein